MDLDMGKRLCDATLGEYLAAERAVGIASAWVSGLVAAGALVLARWGYKRWQARKGVGTGVPVRAEPVPVGPSHDKIEKCCVDGFPLMSVGALWKCPVCGTSFRQETSTFARRIPPESDDHGVIPTQCPHGYKIRHSQGPLAIHKWCACPLCKRGEPFTDFPT